jgi:hypothetical protein
VVSRGDSVLFADGGSVKDEPPLLALGTARPRYRQVCRELWAQDDAEREECPACRTYSVPILQGDNGRFEFWSCSEWAIEEMEPRLSFYCCAWSTRSGHWARDLVAHAMKGCSTKRKSTIYGIHSSRGYERKRTHAR